MVNDFFKKILSSNIKSSTRFGESSVFSKNFNAFHTNIGILFKERRFLYFTKKGPIEVVFNIKHYISAFIISVIFLFKTLQFIFFGASTFFTYLIYQNSEINNQTFTESEIETLKNIAKENKIFDSEKKQIANNGEEFFKNEDAEEDISSVDKLTEKFSKFKAFIKEIPGKFSNDQPINDEVLFEQFSGLASPELVAFEHIYTSNEVLKENKNHKKNNKPHPAICLIRKKDYWKIGGCDEDFVGNYGYTDPSFWYRSQGIVEIKILPDLYLHYYPDGESDINRDNSHNRKLFKQKKKSNNWSNDIIRFKWYKIK